MQKSARKWPWRRRSSGRWPLNGDRSRSSSRHAHSRSGRQVIAASPSPRHQHHHHQHQHGTSPNTNTNTQRQRECQLQQQQPSASPPRRLPCCRVTGAGRLRGLAVAGLSLARPRAAASRRSICRPAKSCSGTSAPTNGPPIRRRTAAVSEQHRQQARSADMHLKPRPWPGFVFSWIRQRFAARMLPPAAHRNAGARRDRRSSSSPSVRRPWSPRSAARAARRTVAGVPTNSRARRWRMRSRSIGV